MALIHIMPAIVARQSERCVMLTFGDLFAGIGGISLGLERAGMHCEWQVENDPFCTKVLQKHWPDVARYGDIRTVDTFTLARVDLIAGGFPCQDISNAGKKEGITGKQSGLWKEFSRIVCDIRPRYVLVENVAALTSRGLDTVLGDLAQLRYDAEWFCLRASDFGAPHRRERLFIVAYTESNTGQLQQGQWAHVRDQSAINGPKRFDVADACCSGRQEQHAAPITEEQRHASWCTRAKASSGQFESRVCGGPDGFPCWLDGYYRWPSGPGEEPFEWEPKRVTQESIPNRAARLKALGNAVIPQIAEYIGRSILESEAKA